MFLKAALSIHIFVKLNTMHIAAKKKFFVNSCETAHCSKGVKTTINLVSNEQPETNAFLHSILNYTGGFKGLRTMAG